MKTIFQNEQDLNKKAELIEANAYCREKTIVKRPYSPGELQMFKDDYCALMEAFTGVEDELKELSSPLKERMKDLKAQAKIFMEKLKSKCEKTEGEIFGFDNQEDGTMDYYDIHGEYISSRRLFPNERQIKLRATNE